MQREQAPVGTLLDLCLKHVQWVMLRIGKTNDDHDLSDLIDLSSAYICIYSKLHEVLGKPAAKYHT
jgi:hypothetical protein